MEKKTFDDFKQQVAEKYNCLDWDMLEDYKEDISIYYKEAAELYHEYGREDQHKISVDYIQNRIKELEVQYKNPQNQIEAFSLKYCIKELEKALKFLEENEK